MTENPADDSSTNPLEILLEHLVYAPVGFLYEYPEIKDKLITKGRSQVQLAKVMAQYASQQNGGMEALLAGALKQAAGGIDKVLSDLGAQFGAPCAPYDGESGPSDSTAESTPRKAGVDDDDADGLVDIDDTSTHREPVHAEDARGAEGPDDDAEVWDDYESLTAREIVLRLDTASEAEVQAVLGYETLHRGRKTVTAKARRILGDYD